MYTTNFLEYYLLLFFIENNKSEPIAHRQKVRILLWWWTIRDSNPGPIGYEPTALTN